jgi:hypothetical protein
MHTPAVTRYAKHIHIFVLYSCSTRKYMFVLEQEKLLPWRLRTLKKNTILAHFTYTELEFFKSLWGLGTEEE